MNKLEPPFYGMEKITAPFSEDQVNALNHYQEHTNFHPFTCWGVGCKKLYQNNGGKLMATPEGWICPCAEFKQDWAYKIMTEPADDSI